MVKKRLKTEQHREESSSDSDCCRYQLAPSPSHSDHSVYSLPSDTMGNNLNKHSSTHPASDRTSTQNRDHDETTEPVPGRSNGGHVPGNTGDPVFVTSGGPVSGNMGSPDTDHRGGTPVQTSFIGQGVSELSVKIAVSSQPINMAIGSHQDKHAHCRNSSARSTSSDSGSSTHSTGSNKRKKLHRKYNNAKRRQNDNSPSRTARPSINDQPGTSGISRNNRIETVDGGNEDMSDTDSEQSEQNTDSDNSETSNGRRKQERKQCKLTRNRNERKSGTRKGRKTKHGNNDFNSDETREENKTGSIERTDLPPINPSIFRGFSFQPISISNNETLISTRQTTAEDTQDVVHNQRQTIATGGGRVENQHAESRNDKEASLDRQLAHFRFNLSPNSGTEIDKANRGPGNEEASQGPRSESEQASRGLRVVDEQAYEDPGSGQSVNTGQIQVPSIPGQVRWPVFNVCFAPNPSHSTKKENTLVNGRSEPPRTDTTATGNPPVNHRNTRAEGETKQTKQETTQTEGETKKTKQETTKTEGETKQSKQETTTTLGETKHSKQETMTTQGETKQTKRETMKINGETNQSKQETMTTQGETKQTKQETMTTQGETKFTHEITFSPWTGQCGTVLKHDSNKPLIICNNPMTEQRNAHDQPRKSTKPSTIKGGNCEVKQDCDKNIILATPTSTSGDHPDTSGEEQEDEENKELTPDDEDYDSESTVTNGDEGALIPAEMGGSETSGASCVTFDVSQSHSVSCSSSSSTFHYEPIIPDCSSIGTSLGSPTLSIPTSDSEAEFSQYESTPHPVIQPHVNWHPSELVRFTPRPIPQASRSVTQSHGRTEVRPTISNPVGPLAQDEFDGNVLYMIMDDDGGVNNAEGDQAIPGEGDDDGEEEPAAELMISASSDSSYNADDEGQPNEYYYIILDDLEDQEDIQDPDLYGYFHIEDQDIQNEEDVQGGSLQDPELQYEADIQDPDLQNDDDVQDPDVEVDLQYDNIPDHDLQDPDLLNEDGLQDSDCQDPDNDLDRNDLSGQIDVQNMGESDEEGAHDPDQWNDSKSDGSNHSNSSVSGWPSDSGSQCISDDDGVSSCSGQTVGLDDEEDESSNQADVEDNVEESESVDQTTVANNDIGQVGVGCSIARSKVTQALAAQASDVHSVHSSDEYDSTESPSTPSTASSHTDNQDNDQGSCQDNNQDPDHDNDQDSGQDKDNDQDKDQDSDQNPDQDIENDQIKDSDQENDQDENEDGSEHASVGEDNVNQVLVREDQSSEGDEGLIDSASQQFVLDYFRSAGRDIAALHDMNVVEAEEPPGSASSSSYMFSDDEVGEGGRTIMSILDHLRTIMGAPTQARSDPLIVPYVPNSPAPCSSQPAIINRGYEYRAPRRTLPSPDRAPSTPPDMAWLRELPSEMSLESSTAAALDNDELESFVRGWRGRQEHHARVNTTDRPQSAERNEDQLDTMELTNNLSQWSLLNEPATTPIITYARFSPIHIGFPAHSRTTSFSDEPFKAHSPKPGCSRDFNVGRHEDSVKPDPSTDCQELARRQFEDFFCFRRNLTPQQTERVEGQRMRIEEQSIIARENNELNTRSHDNIDWSDRAQRKRKADSHGTSARKKRKTEEEEPSETDEVQMEMRPHTLAHISPSLIRLEGHQVAHRTASPNSIRHLLPVDEVNRNDHSTSVEDIGAWRNGNGSSEEDHVTSGDDTSCTDTEF